MKSPVIVIVLGLWFLVGCALSIPAPAPVPATDPGKAPYDVTTPDGTEVRHYDGNDALVWIERHVLAPANDPAGVRIKTYHSDALDRLQWYEYRRFELFGAAWLKTREFHYSAGANAEKDQGTLAAVRSWSFGASGNEVWATEALALGGNLPTLASYRHTWAPQATPAQVWQRGTYGFDTKPLKYERFDYDPAVPTRVLRYAQLGPTADQSLTVTKAGTTVYDGTNVVEHTDYAASVPGTWDRTTFSFVPGTNTEYRRAWYHAVPAVLPSLNGTETGAADTPVDPSASAAAFDPDPTNAYGPTTLVPATERPAPALVAFPTLNAPATWPLDSLTGFEYFLPGAGGGTTLVFDKNQLPVSLSRPAVGLVGALEIDFLWDAEKRLIQRLVKLAGAKVLTVDLERDGQGRVTRINAAGSLLKLPLTSTLAYSGTNLRPDTLVLSSAGQDLLTLTFGYGLGSPSDTAGLEAVNFDDSIASVVLGVGGAADQVRVVQLVWDPPTTAAGVTTRAVTVYDVVGKTDATRAQIGTLTWSFDAARETGLVWHPTSGTDWSYSYAWGTWAQAVPGVVDAAEPWGRTLEATAASALGLADSFDVEKILRLVNAVPGRPAIASAALTQAASNLFDQVQAASTP